MAALGNGRDPESQERLEKIYQNANDAILVVDPETETITDCNPKACELFNCSREELLAIQPSKLVSEENHSCQQVFAEVTDAEGSLTDTLSCQTLSGQKVYVEISLSKIQVDDQPRMLALIRDRTRVHRQQRELQKRSAAMEATTAGIAIIREDGTLDYVNQAFAEIYGYDESDDLHRCKWSELYGDDEWNRIQSEVLPTVRLSDQWRGELRGQRRNGTTVPQAASVAALEESGFVCSVREITERKDHIETLETLNDSARSLIAAQDRDAIAQIAIDLVDDVLGFDVACVRLFDSARNALDPIAMTNEAEVLVESCQAFDLDTSSAGRAYRQGIRVKQTKDDVICAGSSATARVHVPLDQFGTLSVFSRTPEFDELDLRCIEILAANITTALEQTEREETLWTKKRELDRQRAELETVNQINQLVQQLIHQLVETTTQEEVYQTVCDRIASSEFYDSAWIGTFEIETGTVTRAVGSEVSEAYLELLESKPITQIADGIVGEAVRTESLQMIHQYRQRGIQEEQELIETPEDETMIAVPCICELDELDTVARARF